MKELAQSEIYYPTVFIDESGVSDTTDNPQPYYGIGFLKVSDPDKLNYSLMQFNYNVRNEAKVKRREMIKGLENSPRRLQAKELHLLLASTRHYEFHFSEISSDNLVHYLSFIDTLFLHDFQFFAYLINRRDPAFDPISHGNYWEALIRGTSYLCAQNLHENERAIVIADFTHKPKDSELDYHRELTSLPKVCTAMMMHSVGVPLLQACDLLLGGVIHACKQAQPTFQNPTSTTVQAKNDLLRHLSTKLELEDPASLCHNFSKSGTPSFSVWEHDFNQK
ncbi:MAG: DUF3800 domain-containing protein [Candidatus Caenarcaniphilales bacterium]|nr:DUF3800 domain-containing protein [Candidatus Caenarcaniphilales bacterium]